MLFRSRSLSTSTEKPQPSVYFDPILNTRALQTQPVSKTSFTEHLNSIMMQKQLSYENEQELKGLQSLKYLRDETSTESPTTTSTTPDTAATVSYETYLQNKRKKKVKLSSADFLRLCFVSQIGCDFSENDILEEHVQSLTTSVPPSKPLNMDLKLERTPKKVSSNHKLREMIRQCFFSGVCANSYVQEKKDDVGVMSTTEQSLPTSTPSYRQQVLQRQIEEQARACFYEGKCS